VFLSSYSRYMNFYELNRKKDRIFGMSDRDRETASYHYKSKNKELWEVLTEDKSKNRYEKMGSRKNDELLRK